MCCALACFGVLWRALAFSKAFQSKVLWNQSTLLWYAVVLVKPQTVITQSIILLFSLLFFYYILIDLAHLAQKIRGRRTVFWYRYQCLKSSALAKIDEKMIFKCCVWHQNSPLWQNKIWCLRAFIMLFQTKIYLKPYLK